MAQIQMSADTSKMEEVINKPDDQFEGTLIDLLDYKKETSEKEALMKELYQNETSSQLHIKPAASINSSTYSSAASSSSSSSSSSSTNSASSTSSTLSSPSQSNLTTSKTSDDPTNKESPNKAVNELEMALFEDLGKQATIVEHRSGDNVATCFQNFKNFVTAGTTPFHLHDPRVQYKYAMDNNRARSTINNLTGSKGLGPRKKRPAERPVLSEHIPGHIGEQELELLVKYIESGVTNQQPNSSNSSSATNHSKKNNSNNNNNTNKRAKSQPKKSNQLDNEQSRKSCNNVNTNNNTNMAEGKPAPSNHQRPVQNTQNKAPMQSNQQSTSIQQHQQQQQPSQRKAQPPLVSNQKHMNHQVTSNSIDNKPSKPSRVHKEQSSASQIVNKQSVKPALAGSKRSQDGSQMSKEEGRGKARDYAVTFADHIKISDEDVTAQYTFGFFDEQNKPKQMKTSRKSDHRRYVFNDNIDANSFNYKQILEFISKSWKQTVATNTSKQAS